MNAAFVLDCSVAMTWCFKDEGTSQTTALLNRLESEAALVPDLWFIEVANVLVTTERRGRYSRSQAMEFMDQMQRLPLEVDAGSAAEMFILLPELCRTHGLTAYDAVYLELAMRRQRPLATLDLQLRSAGEKAGVDLLGL